MLGIGSLWEVKTEDLKLLEKEVVIELGWQWGVVEFAGGGAVRGGELGQECGDIVRPSGVVVAARETR